MSFNNFDADQYYENNKIEDYYILGETIGEGTFGKVKNGLHKLTGQKVTKN